MPTILDDLRLQFGSFAAIFRPTALSADRVILPPNKNGTMLVDADWAVPGAIGTTTPNNVAAINLTNTGTLASTPTATQTLIATTTINVNGAVMCLSSTAAITLTSTPNVKTSGIANGTAIEVWNTGSFNITLQDSGTLASSGLRLGQPSWVIYPGKCLRLRYLSTYSQWVNTLGFSDAVAIGSTTKETYSATVPTSPSTGDLWLELDGANYPLYGWFWRWNGTYWLSPDLVSDCAFPNISVASYYYPACNPGFNYYFKSLNLTAFTTVAQSAGNLWTVTLDRRTANNTGTVFSTVTTSGNISTTWSRNSANVSTHVNISTTSTYNFLLTIAPTGISGSLYAQIQVIFNYARI